MDCAKARLNDRVESPHSRADSAIEMLPSSRALKSALARSSCDGASPRDAFLDDQADQILATTDAMAERVRKLGAGTLKSVQHVARLARLVGNEADSVTPSVMLNERHGDNERLSSFMRDAHFVCGGFDDVASMSLLENWIDEAEKRSWFLRAAGVRLHED